MAVEPKSPSSSSGEVLVDKSGKVPEEKGEGTVGREKNHPACTKRGLTINKVLIKEGAKRHFHRWEPYL